MIYELAGIVGVEPGGLTLRELFWMAEGCQKQQWNHTAALMALTANVNRDPKKGRAFKPRDFHPYEKKPEAKRVIVVDKENIKVLREAFENSPQSPDPSPQVR